MSDLLKQHADTPLPLQGRDKPGHQQWRRKLKVLQAQTDVCLHRWCGKFNLTFSNLQKQKENLSIIHRVVTALFYHLLFIFSFQRGFILAFSSQYAQCKIIVMDVLLLSIGGTIILMDSTHGIRNQQQRFGFAQITLHDPASTKKFRFKWGEKKKEKIFLYDLKEHEL